MSGTFLCGTVYFQYQLRSLSSFGTAGSESAFTTEKEEVVSFISEKTNETNEVVCLSLALLACLFIQLVLIFAGKTSIVG